MVATDGALRRLRGVRAMGAAAVEDGKGTKVAAELEGHAPAREPNWLAYAVVCMYRAVCNGWSLSVGLYLLLEGHAVEHVQGHAGS